MIDWESVFKNAHLTSWPTSGLTISNRKPPHDTARNIFEEDEAEIMRAANKYGYRRLTAMGTKGKHPKAVTFIGPMPGCLYQ